VARRLVEPDVVALGLRVGHGHQRAGARVAGQVIGEGGADEVNVKNVAQVGQDVAPQGGQVDLSNRGWAVAHSAAV